MTALEQCVDALRCADSLITDARCVRSVKWTAYRTTIRQAIERAQDELTSRRGERRQVNPLEQPLRDLADDMQQFFTRRLPADWQARWQTHLQAARNALDSLAVTRHYSSCASRTGGECTCDAIRSGVSRDMFGSEKVRKTK